MNVLGLQTACTAVAIALHYFFAVLFTFLLLESIQAYIIVTSVIPRGSCLPRWKVLALGWLVPAIAISLTAIFHHSHYVTPIMWGIRFSWWYSALLLWILFCRCFLDLEGDAVGAVLAPIIIVLILAIITTEAAGMGEDFYPKLENHDKTQMTTNKWAWLFIQAWFFFLISCIIFQIEPERFGSHSALGCRSLVV